jgi:hypothetical protein
MAFAKVGFKVKLVEHKQRDGVVLTLNEAEAETLLLILGKVGGSSEGRRGHADAIFGALEKAGVDWKQDVGTGSINLH